MNPTHPPSQLTFHSFQQLGFIVGSFRLIRPSLGGVPLEATLRSWGGGHERSVVPHSGLAWQWFLNTTAESWVLVYVVRALLRRVYLGFLLQSYPLVPDGRCCGGHG